MTTHSLSHCLTKKLSISLSRRNKRKRRGRGKRRRYDVQRKKERRSYICPLSMNKKKMNNVTKSGRNNVSEDVISSYAFSSVKPFFCLLFMSLYLTSTKFESLYLSELQCCVNVKKIKDR